MSSGPKRISLSALLALLSINAFTEPIQLAALTDVREPATGAAAAAIDESAGDVRSDIRLAAAHNAYGLWTQALTAALLPDESIGAWREFMGLGTNLGESYKQLAEAAYQQQDYQRAANLYSAARDLLPDDDSFVGRLGFAYKETGQYEKAEELLFQASLIEPENHDVWIWLGDVQRLLGNYDDAYVSMLAAVENAPQADKESIQNYVTYTQGLASTIPDWTTFERHREFANRHNTNGRWRRVIAEYHKSLDVAPAVGFDATDGPLRKGWVNKTIASNYNHMKEFDVALDHWRRSIALYESVESWSDVALVLQSLGVTYHWLADRDTPDREKYLEQAVATWDRLLETAPRGGHFEHGRYALGAKLLDLIALRPVDDPEVVALREEVQAELPWSPPINEFSVAVIAEAEIACRMKEGDYAGARIVLEMVMPYYVESNFLTESERGGRLLTTLAQAYNMQGHHDQALTQTDSALAELAEFREFLDADGFNRSSSGKTYRYIYAGRARALLGLEQPEDALHELEAYKARTRLDLLGSKIVDDSAWIDYRTEEELIRWRVPKLEAELEAAYAERDEVLSTHLEKRIEADGARLSRLEKAIGFPPPGRLSLRQIETLETEELRAALPADLTLVHLVLDAYGGVAVVSGPDGVSGTLLPDATDAAVQDLVNTFLDQKASDTAAANNALGELYSSLIAPLREKLTTELIAFATDETLSLLPFDALHDGTGRALLDDFAIVRTPSGAYLAQALAQDRTDHAAALAMVSRPDFASGVEQALGAGGFAPAETLAADAAIEDALAPGAHNFDVLHLAAPADFLHGDAMLSSVELAAGPQTDGSLLASELLTMSLPASLVVLDLDVTSGDATVPGRGLGALAEGLVHTGAPSLLYNLWSADAEASAAFFTAFYGNLESMTKAQALRAAKQSLRAAEADGFTWSAYVLHGDYR